MTSPDHEYLRHILESAKRVLSYVSGMTIEVFLETPLAQDAVLHRLSVIGEAAKWVSQPTRDELPDVEWRRMIAMRNFVVHEYWSTDLNVTWDTVQKKLPPLVERLEAYLR